MFSDHVGIPWPSETRIKPDEPFHILFFSRCLYFSLFISLGECCNAVLLDFNWTTPLKNELVCYSWGVSKSPDVVGGRSIRCFHVTFECCRWTPSHLLPWCRSEECALCFSSPPGRAVATTHLCIYCQYVLQGQAGQVEEGRDLSFEKMLNTKPGVCVDKEGMETKCKEETPKRHEALQWKRLYLSICSKWISK